MTTRRYLVPFIFIVLLIGLAGPAHAQEPDTFRGVLEYIADELDASANQGLRATSQPELAQAISRMAWANEQLALLTPPMSFEGNRALAALDRWADFQQRAFENYPDRTYEYLYHDTRSEFIELLAGLPADLANRPYALADLPDTDTPTTAPERPAMVARVLEQVGMVAVPGWDSTHLTYSPDDRYLIRAGTQTSDWIDLETMERSLDVITNYTTMSIATSESPLVLAAVNPGEGVTTWDLTTQQALATLPADQLITDVAISRDARMVVGAGVNGLNIWEYTRTTHHLTGSTVHGVAFSPDNRLLAAGVAAGGEAAPGVYVFDTETWEPVQEWLAGPDNAGTVVDTLLFSPDNRTVAIVCSQTGVRLRDAETGDLLHRLTETDFARDAAFSPDGRWLAVVGGTYLHVYDVASGELAYQQQQVEADDDSFRKVAFSTSGLQIATSNTYEVRFFEMPE